MTDLLDRIRARWYEGLSPEERARVDDARREREADAALPRAEVLAVRTNLATGIEEYVPVKLVIRLFVGALRAEERWICLEGGPTGYESMPADRLEAAIEAGGWTACTGTAGRWDRLHVPVDSLMKAGKELGIL